MRGRKPRWGSLVALVGALVLVLGAAPGFAQQKPAHIFETKPDKGKRDYPHKANRVTVKFTEALAESTEGKETTITVRDACDRLLSNNTTQRAMAPASEDEWVERAFVELDRRKTNPKGVYSVVISYWLASDEAEENPENPDEEDPANQEPRTYQYSFHVHGGPNCDGTKPGGGHGGHGDGDNNKNRSWGNSSGSGHDGSDGHTGHENLRTATGSTDHTDHTNDLTPFTSPTIPSTTSNHTNHTGSTTPFGEDDFGDPFGDSTGTSPLSDPTDPSLYESDPVQIPEEAEDQQTLSAAPAEELGPESSMLVVALTTALLLGVGGGLFLRRTDPAPIRSRS